MQSTVEYQHVADLKDAGNHQLMLFMHLKHTFALTNFWKGDMINYLKTYINREKGGKNHQNNIKELIMNSAHMIISKSDNFRKI